MGVAVRLPSACASVWAPAPVCPSLPVLPPALSPPSARAHSLAPLSACTSARRPPIPSHRPSLCHCQPARLYDSTTTPSPSPPLPTSPPGPSPLGRRGGPTTVPPGLSRRRPSPWRRVHRSPGLRLERRGPSWRVDHPIFSPTLSSSNRSVVVIAAGCSSTSNYPP